MLDKVSIAAQIDHENQLVKLETFALGSPSVPIDETTFSLDKLHTICNKKVGQHIYKMNREVAGLLKKKEPRVIVSHLNIESLYPVTTSSSEAIPVLRSPIDILVKGREELSRLARGATTVDASATHSQLQQTKECNQQMLDKVNAIRKTDLEVCTSLLGGFMEQQDIDIPLAKSRQDSTTAVFLTATATVGVWALFSLDYSHVQPT